MNKKTRTAAWSWIKFLFLMFCVGALPFTVEAPLPLALALVTATVLAAASLVCDHISRSGQASVPRPFFAAVGRPRAFTLVYPVPVAPGTPGTVRSRAPSRVQFAH